MATFVGEFTNARFNRMLRWENEKSAIKQETILSDPREERAVKERWIANDFGVLPGFLRTRPFPDRTSGSGGNLALRDITMGLRWVRENIGAFGGDPERVTLMGHDTGAALVNLVLLAPYSKGKRQIAKKKNSKDHLLRAKECLKTKLNYPLKRDKKKPKKSSDARDLRILR